MAKARKTASDVTASASEKKTPARKAPAKVGARAKKAAKPAPAQAPSAPLIDTDLAAANAARMLAAKAKLHVNLAQPQPTEPQKESASFKQLKESFNKPAASAVNTALGNAFGPAKSNLPTHGAERQVAHNQTQGVARVNVPRRTAG